MKCDEMRRNATYENQPLNKPQQIFTSHRNRRGIDFLTKETAVEGKWQEQYTTSVKQPRFENLSIFLPIAHIEISSIDSFFYS